MGCGLHEGDVLGWLYSSCDLALPQELSKPKGWRWLAPLCHGSSVPTLASPGSVLKARGEEMAVLEP